MISRRRFFGLLAAPAIVQVANLMPIRGEILRIDEFSLAGDFTIDFWVRRGMIEGWRLQPLELAPADYGWRHITISK